MTNNTIPKIMLCCDTLPTNPWERDRLPAIRKALAGYQDIITDIFDFHSIEEAHEIHRNKLHETFFSEHELNSLNELFCHKILKSGCNILILGTVDCYSWFLFPESIKKLRDRGLFIIGILGDDEFMYKRNRLYVPLFDRTIAYVKECVDKYNNIIADRCLWLPNSCHTGDSSFEKLQVPEEEKKYDVLLMGAPFGVRPQIVRKLVENNINIAIFGSQKWEEYDDLRPYYHGYLKSDVIDRTIQKSKIILSLLEDHLTGALHMNTKIWEAVRNGQFCIASFYKPLIDDYNLRPDRDIVLYRSVDDLVVKVKRYLSNNASRKSISKNLYEIIKTRFDYEHLYQDLFKVFSSTFNSRPDIHPPDSQKDITPLITIIDISGTNRKFKGYIVVRGTRDAGFIGYLKNNFNDLITTPYVICTTDGMYYSKYLNQMVYFFPDEFNNGIAAILSRESVYKEKMTRSVTISRTVWESDKFRRMIHTEESIDTVIPGHIEVPGTSFGNLRLCSMNPINL